jgi:hypothetical protein
MREWFSAAELTLPNGARVAPPVRVPYDQNVGIEIRAGGEQRFKWSASPGPLLWPPIPRASVSRLQHPPASARAWLARGWIGWRRCEARRASRTSSVG